MKKLRWNDEVYQTIQALLMALCVLLLSYQGFSDGRSDYSILDDGQIVSGRIASSRTVVSLSVGYEFPYSLVVSSGACMLLYSLLTVITRLFMLFFHVFMITKVGRNFEI